MAKLLVSYSTGVKPGERVMIAMSEVESFPLVHAVYEATIEAGGFPQVQFLSEDLRQSVLTFGNEAQLRWVPEIEAYGMEWADVYFGLRGAHYTKEGMNVPPERLAANQAAIGKISTLRWEKTRWCLVRLPNGALALQADTDLPSLMDLFFNACLIDWEEMAAILRQWVNRLNGTSELRIIGPETDLRFSSQGRRWVAADGKLNMPDGEVFTSPVTETVNGQISFELPGVLGGRMMDHICLRWAEGCLVEARSSTNQEFLKEIVRTDPGASLIGEFGIGSNTALTRFCMDSLLDEKIAGTVHIALGRAYPECGGINQSSIHWDIVKDMRQQGTVYADGKPVLQNGVFLI